VIRGEWAPRSSTEYRTIAACAQDKRRRRWTEGIPAVLTRKGTRLLAGSPLH
jgi:hypothetical protein